MKPATAPLLLGIGSGLIVAALFVHLFSPAGPDTAPAATGGAVGAAPSPAGGDVPGTGTEPGRDPDSERDTDAAADPAADPETDPETETDADSRATPGQSPVRPAAPAVPGVPGTVTVTVPDGATGSTVAKLLREAGLVADEDGFLRFMQERQATTRLRVGTYSFGPDESLESILDRLTTGKTAPPAP